MLKRNKLTWRNRNSVILWRNCLNV